MRAEMDADIGVRVSTHLTDARTGTRCGWYTRLAAECTCPPAQARCPPLGTADDHVAADWLDGDGASTFAERVLGYGATRARTEGAVPDALGQF